MSRLGIGKCFILHNVLKYKGRGKRTRIAQVLSSHYQCILDHVISFFFLKYWSCHFYSWYDAHSIFLITNFVVCCWWRNWMRCKSLLGLSSLLKGWRLKPSADDTDGISISCSSQHYTHMVTKIPSKRSLALFQSGIFPVTCIAAFDLVVVMEI